MSFPGAVGRFLDDVGKRRPCVVLAVGEHALLIAYGTSTAGRDFAFVEVGERTVTGRVLRLTGPTFFYKPNVVAVAAERVELITPGRCSAQAFIQLRALAELD